MTQKEFLQQAGNTHLAVESRLEQIARLQSLATKATTVMNGVPTAGTSAGSVIETRIGEVQEQSALLAEEISRMVDARNEVAEAIARVTNPDERCLLELRYLCHYSWEQIAKILTFSVDHVFTLHRQALKNLTVNNS
ncbi:MAG: sigma-70 family RNA polymerase sigma factor [Selenomonadaceae bacterium]|nr:sigma-70 family RNA polymerase sigma factor [Selenomonadaceae bacterium]